MDLTFAIIGPGSVGSVLRRSLESRGFEISAVIRRGDDVGDLPDSTTAVGICTPDGSIAEVTETLSTSRSSWGGKLVFHVSGALTSEILAPLALLGAHTLSFHPLSTYPPDQAGRDLTGTTIALEGHARAVDLMSDVARRLGGIPVVLSIRQKGAYHLAASMASNFLVTLSSSVQAVLDSAGLDPHLMDGLVADTLSNLGSNPAAEALTGPLVRGDAETVRLHLETLTAVAPEWIPFYKAMATATIKMASTSKHIDAAQQQTLEAVLKEHPDNHG